MILCSISTGIQAQQTKTAEGTIRYMIPQNLTLAQAEFYAVEQAKLQIIADNFGTIISRSDALTFKNKDGISSVESLTNAGLEVRGEWIATIGEPKIKRIVENNEYILVVSIRGQIREIISAPIDFHAKVLRNGVTDNCESDTFKQGDKMYMSFQTPEDGYVSIYITDGEVVQCLYPYKGLGDEIMKIEEDRRYIFFSKENSGELDPLYVPERRLGCNDDNEHDRIYLIFSPNKYSKAVDHSDENEIGPRTLSFKDFHSWLSRLRRFDKELTYKVFDIVINK